MASITQGIELSCNMHLIGPIGPDLTAAIRLIRKYGTEDERRSAVTSVEKILALSALGAIYIPAEKPPAD